MKAPFLLIPCLLFLGPVLRAQTIEIKKFDPNMTLEKADSKGIAWFAPAALHSIGLLPPLRKPVDIGFGKTFQRY